MTSQPLRLVVFDATDRGGPWARRARTPASDGRSAERIGLAPVWWLGARTHRLLGGADAWCGVDSWDEALGWARDVATRRGRPIGSLQAWGHGGWGFMRLGQTRLDAAGLEPASALGTSLDALAGALAGPEALVWLRCCSAFGSEGRHFARMLADRLGCRVAGHTHVIGFFQSGTHSIAPGVDPSWDPTEGVIVREGQAASARGSSPFAPNTVTCMHLDLPAAF